MRTTVVGALSGAVWGAIAWVIGDRLTFPTPALVTAVALSPVIGVLAAWAIRPLSGLDWQGGVMASLGLLYFTSALFGFLAGLAATVRHVGQTTGLVGALSVAATVPIGMTLSGLVLALWPLALLNCRLVWALTVDANLQPPTSNP